MREGGLEGRDEAIARSDWQISTLSSQEADGQLSADAVEIVGCWQKRTVELELEERGHSPSSCGGLRDRVEFGELSEVLGCCCEVELVAGAVRTA